MTSSLEYPNEKVKAKSIIENASDKDNTEQFDVKKEPKEIHPFSVEAIANSYNPTSSGNPTDWKRVCVLEDKNAAKIRPFSSSRERFSLSRNLPLKKFHPEDNDQCRKLHPLNLLQNKIFDRLDQTFPEGRLRLLDDHIHVMGTKPNAFATAKLTCDDGSKLKRRSSGEIDRDKIAQSFLGDAIFASGKKQKVANSDAEMENGRKLTKLRTMNEDFNSVVKFLDRTKNQLHNSGKY